MIPLEPLGCSKPDTICGRCTACPVQVHAKQIHVVQDAARQRIDSDIDGEHPKTSLGRQVRCQIVYNVCHGQIDRVGLSSRAWTVAKLSKRGCQKYEQP